MKRKTTSKTAIARTALTTTCGICGETLRYKVLGNIQTTIVKHFESNHPDRKAQCYDVAGQTWDPQYDACLKALHETTRQRDKMMLERDEAAKQQRTLAAKLNAIVLVLRNDA